MIKIFDLWHQIVEKVKRQNESSKRQKLITNDFTQVNSDNNLKQIGYFGQSK